MFTIAHVIKERQEKKYDSVPIALGKKAPAIKKWQDIDQFSESAYEGVNIGCRGTRVMPIDIDDACTARIALTLFNDLFDDPAVYDSRPSRPISHFFVDMPDGAPRTCREKSPVTFANYPSLPEIGGRYLIELKHHRGLQAMTAPSMHPSGEQLQWSTDRDETPTAPVLSYASIDRWLRMTWLSRALVALWREGSRHHLMLWAGTWLHESGVSRETAAAVARAVLEEAKADLPVAERDNAYQSFLADWDSQPSGRPRKGWGGVSELIGANVAHWTRALRTVWPALVPGAARIDAVRWVPAASEARLERALQKWTMITSRRVPTVYVPELGGEITVPTLEHALGRVGQIAVGPRGGECFTHLVQLWLENTEKRIARDVAYLPAHPTGVIVDQLLNVFSRGPIWNAALRIGGETQDVSWYTDWCARVIPDAEEREWFHRWVAAVLARPWELRGWAPYLITHTHGMGRTAILQLLRRIMGSENCLPISIDVLKSKFTDWAGMGVLRYASEARESGRDRGYLVTRMHDYISDIEVMLNRKGMQPLQVHNHGGYVLVSNSSADVRVSAEDRRICCIRCGTTKATDQEKAQFFDHANDKQSLIAVCQWYLDLAARTTLSTEAPHTTTREDIVEQSQTTTEMAISTAVEELGRVFLLSDVVDAIDGVSYGNRRSPERIAKVSAMLRAAGYCRIRTNKRRATVEGVKVTFMCHHSDYPELSKASGTTLRKLLKTKGKLRISNVLNFPKKED